MKLRPVTDHWASGCFWQIFFTPGAKGRQLLGYLATRPCALGFNVVGSIDALIDPFTKYEFLYNEKSNSTVLIKYTASLFSEAKAVCEGGDSGTSGRYCRQVPGGKLSWQPPNLNCLLSSELRPVWSANLMYTLHQSHTTAKI